MGKVVNLEIYKSINQCSIKYNIPKDKIHKWIKLINIIKNESINQRGK